MAMSTSSLASGSWIYTACEINASTTPLTYNRLMKFDRAVALFALSTLVVWAAIFQLFIESDPFRLRYACQPSVIATSG